jgi:cytoskeletal protein CcmA (bactofilin family)
MKHPISHLIVFLILILITGTTTPHSINPDYISQHDIEIMQAHPDVDFIVLTDDLRSAILEAATEQQDAFACASAVRLIQEGFSTIPYELALDVVAEIEIMQINDDAATRTCKSKAFNNLSVKNILSSRKLRVCDGGIISGGLVINSIVPTRAGVCINPLALTVNGKSIFNGPIVANCGIDLAGDIIIDGNETITGNLTVDGCITSPCLDITGTATINSLNVLTNEIIGGSLVVDNCITASCLEITGTATIADLTVTGTLIAHTLVVTNTLTNFTSITVTGTATINTLDVINNETIGGDLTVDGCIHTPCLDVTGTATINNLDVTAQLLLILYWSPVMKR